MAGLRSRSAQGMVRSSGRAPPDHRRQRDGHHRLRSFAR